MEKLNRFCTWFSNQIVVWVVLTVAVGFFFPRLLLPLKDYSDWLFAFTMLGIGMVLHPRDFAQIFKKPAASVLGASAQYLIMPALGFIIGRALGLPPELVLGLIIAGAVPDAMACGVMAYLGNADVALSVSVTLLTTIASPFLTPGFTYILGQAYIPVNFLPMFLSIVKIVIIPLGAGILIRMKFEKKVEKITPVFPAFSTVFIAFICALVTALNKDYLTQISPLIFVAVVLHNFLGLVLGYYAAKLFGFSEKVRRTLALTVGMQNAGLGAVLAIKHFSNQVAIPNVLFAVWSIVSASLVVRWWKKRDIDKAV